MSPVCVFMKVMLCFLHHKPTLLVVGFASSVAVLTLSVLYTPPLNKLTNEVQVYHMFSVQAETSACYVSLRILNAGSFL